MMCVPHGNRPTLKIFSTASVLASMMTTAFSVESARYSFWSAVSVVAARAAGLPIIATGGIRTGLDAAKAIALGASLVGIARPLLVAALKGPAAVEAWIGQFLEELRAAVFLTGGKRVDDLRSVPRAIVGDTRRWVDALEG